jgi:hypothetical protein
MKTNFAPRSSARTRRKAARAAALAAALLIGALSCCCAQTAPAAPTAPAPAPPQPAEAATPVKMEAATLLVLLRTILIALDEANKTGNYSVLRDMGAPDFTATNNVARLAEIFASQRKDQLDMSGVAALEPQLTLRPQIEPNGMLHFAGYYPAGAAQLKFEFLFQSVNKQWRLYGLAVNLAQPAAAANAPAASAPAASATAVEFSTPDSSAATAGVKPAASAQKDAPAAPAKKTPVRPPAQP